MAFGKHAKEHFMTRFSKIAAVAAAALVKFLSSESALPVMKKMGLEPW